LDARIVVTCRTKPYEQDESWQLREDWTVRILQPFTFGQVRHFVPAWYTQTCQSSQALYSLDAAQLRSQRLVRALEQRVTLQEITASPLLLTMLVLLDYNHKELPEKRGDVYEELVKLLLDRWEGVRSSDQDSRQQSIGERLELPHLTTDDLRPVIHELAFEAHQQVVDGRGVLSGALLRDKLDAFFARQLNPANPRAVPRDVAVQRSDRFERLLREETGLVQEEADESYVLPHLTFEEYLAACHLAGREDVALVYQQWTTAADRWREAIVLLMGRLLHQEKLGMAWNWLHLLVATRCGITAKSIIQRQRDALLAATCYKILGRQTYLAGRAYDVLGFEEQLRAALIDLLEQPDPAILLAQRIEAADALGALGDSRFPITLDQWRGSLAPLYTFDEAPRMNSSRRVEAAGRSYWCSICSGVYSIGGWKDTMSRADINLPAFWIARFPITVAQYALFVQAGYGVAARRWWTPEGWRWKEQRQRTKPSDWNRPPFTGSNQPVIGVSWYEAAAFCAWLNEQVAEALPPDYVIRLPTEAEWEASAAYDQQQCRFYPWGAEAPTAERVIYNASNIDRPAPVGCCPMGAAACGALDMAGNVWEVTTSSYRNYPLKSGDLKKDFTADEFAVPWRGGSWRYDSKSLHCSVRVRSHPDDVRLHHDGFRVVIAPRQK
jgi:formylglycine-generating enzyme required for sulfatase activity